MFLKVKLLIFFGFIALINFAQKPVAAISLRDENILYRAYDNQVIPAVTNNKSAKVVLKGKNVEISKQENSDYYVVRPGLERIAFLYVVLEKGKKSDTIETFSYHVSDLPNPSLFWGGASVEQTANIREKLLFLKYTPEIPLNAYFQIQSWELIHKNDTIKGEGNSLLQAENYLKTIQENTSIQINVIGFGPDQVKRSISGKWNVYPWDTEINDPPKFIKCEG
jgi:hypothetical protein